MWNISFISEDDFHQHVEATILKYGEKLEPYNLKKFNSNIIDPIKLIFDKTVYSSTWDEIIKNEIFRQRDKSNNNDIGYFHQNLFSYINGCTVPEQGWDIIFKNTNANQLPTGDTPKTIYVEMKNKHNTMNSASAGKTYIKMQNQLLKDDDCACFLVEAIAKKSTNEVWKTTVDKSKVSHKFIRRVSMDNFYALVTGEEDAFFQVCMALPAVIKKVVETSKEKMAPIDTVLSELKSNAEKLNIADEDLAFAMAIYMLGFSTYNGFT